MPKTTEKKRSRGKKENIALKDIEINDDFLKAVHALEHSDDCIFLTGRAGTGKSTLLRYFKEKTSKNIVILASTGIAAINVGGQTIHSFFMLPPRFIQSADIQPSFKNRQIIQKLDTLVIDEASMVRADVMDAVDYSLRVNRGRMNTPFGGVQVILFGDLHQLPPVVEPELKEAFSRKYESPYFFHAHVFSEIGLECVELKKIYRQKDSSFVEILNRIRDKRHGSEDLKALNRQVLRRAAEADHITLTTTNRDAAAINELRLSQLPQPAYEYSAKVSGRFEESAFPGENRLVLKKGAQVMLTKNDLEQKRWVNGTLARVEDLTENSIVISVGDEQYEVPMASWEKSQYVYNEESEKIEQETVGVFRQYPLRLAWAVTIHKSQGQTFENVVIDTGAGVFAHGQLYVALSRCTKLDGIRLRRPIVHSDVKFDERVLKFNASAGKTYLAEKKPSSGSKKCRFCSGDVDFEAVECGNCGGFFEEFVS